MSLEYNRVWINDNIPNRLSINNNEYIPVFYKRLKGISDNVHNVVDYVHDEKKVYFVAGKNKVVRLRCKNINQFRAIYFNVGLDNEYVYCKNKAYRIEKCNTFKLFDDE